MGNTETGDLGVGKQIVKSKKKKSKAGQEEGRWWRPRTGEYLKGRKSGCERVKNGEKERHGWSTMEKNEWVLGVCISDWGRPLSDRERCGRSQW